MPKGKAASLRKTSERAVTRFKVIKKINAGPSEFVDPSKIYEIDDGEESDSERHGVGHAPHARDKTLNSRMDRLELAAQDLLNKCDADGDGKLSVHEVITALLKRPGLLEPLGIPEVG